LTVLQMNLCNSGVAGCYTGRAVAQAAEVIRAETPDVVMLNEICDGDLDPLARTLGEVRQGGTVLTAFEAAFSLRTGQEVSCRNGRLFGVGLLVRVPGKDPQARRDGGRYPTQSPRGEQRVWVCLYVAARMQACTTHLALGGNGISLAQCRHLLGTAIPAMRDDDVVLPTVVGGDLNLGAADTLPCLPPDYSRTDDGAVQHVMAGAGLVIASSRTIDMGGATDHPGLVVTVEARRH
jgi:endonuclease/exonuclease/phosphatase family metal-dependent hydrolase